MIRRLRGVVVQKFRNQLVVETSGVGYGVFVTPAAITNIAVDTQAMLFVAESIREDAHDLYGFISEAERDIFETLRQVSGVGPKMALGLVGFYPPDELMTLINSANISALSLVPGVGKKLAEKIVVELKDKRSPIDFDSTESIDLASALGSLGYSRGEVANIIVKIPKDISGSDAKLTWALRQLASK